MTIDNLIRGEILRVLKEEKKDDQKKKPGADKEKKKTVKAKPGRGRVKTYIKQAKARADLDPLGLMKSLKVDVGRAGVENASKFEEKIERIVRAALVGTSEMRAAFRGIRLENTAAIVSMEGLSARDGVMFINHIITAAQGAQFVTLDKDISVEPAGDKVVIKFIQTG